MKHLRAPTAPRSFRLISAFSDDHNIDRLRVFCDRLKRQPDNQRWMRSVRLNRRVRAGLKAAPSSNAA
jgi:hypothetical protein